MAQSSWALDIQVLNDLRQRFPEIPETVVSQCMFQNNNNFEACSRILAQESSRYLYGEYHSPNDARVNRNHLLHISLGIQPHNAYQVGDIGQHNGGRTLVHSSSDGHIDPQHGSNKQLLCIVQEPHSAPAVVATSTGYNPFFMGDQSRNTPTPPPTPPQPTSMQPGMNTSAMQGPSTYMHVPRYNTSPVTVAVSQNLSPGPAVPRALQILPQITNNPCGTPNSVYVGQTSQSPSGRRTPQNIPWHSSSQGSVSHYSPHGMQLYQQQHGFQQSQYSSKQVQIHQSSFRSPPPSQCPSPFSSPQHPVPHSQLSHQTSQVFMPISPSAVSPHAYPQLPANYQKHSGASVSSLLQYGGMPKNQMNKIEISVEPPQRPGTSNRSPSPKSSQPSPQTPHPLYVATTPGSPSRGISGQTRSPFNISQCYMKYTQSSGTAGAQTVTPRVLVSQQNPNLFKIPVASTPPESILNLVDQEEHSGAPEPIQPISALSRTVTGKGSQLHQKVPGSGSDDYAYVQALLLHQRARMERIAKQLELKKHEMEKLKTEVNEMEYDLVQRRLRKVTWCTSNPTVTIFPNPGTSTKSYHLVLWCHQSRVLKKMVPALFSQLLTDDILGGCCWYRPEHRQSTKQAPVSNVQDEEFEGAPWNCESCTFLNHPALNRCEQCEMPRYT
ncbi:TGF-beta-activated kinase 1 and MAP3K7-binding protein 3 isoform X2 [Protopterus annectens]|uniref:TGF-beta-activated kinase 1 and MAP3K7-binding protein 3 isoform X2 n=1 Tax=Protopterus annectens TaxID=7888 RepID=UPI001CFB5B93|nr:TGF-beta-activated kinase 1 and MAP3K7-binding protein 3 isoform X2 [Protopterus annectens]